MTRLRQAARLLFAAAAFGFGYVSYVYLTLPDVRPLATANPVSTAFMELRAREALASGKPVRQVQRWMAYGRISQNLKRAVLVAEDSAFFEHEGVDLEQLRESIQINLERGAAVRGASTITQQLAKNLYLSPSRDPMRKLRELIIARRLEVELSKARILELYLNVVEWGDGVWGADAAARRYFRTPASALSREQAALMAGALVNPRVLTVSRPPRRLQRRQRIILARMRTVEPPPAPRVALAPPPAVLPADEPEAEAPPAMTGRAEAVHDAQEPDAEGSPQAAP